MNGYTDALGFVTLTALCLLIIGISLLALSAGAVVFVRWLRR